MRQRGELRPEADPEELATALMEALQGGMLLTQTKRHTAPLEAALNSMLSYIESFATDKKVVSTRRTRESHSSQPAPRRRPQTAKSQP